MLKHKPILFLLFTFLVIGHGYSQKLKYKELYPIIKSDSISFVVARQLLSDYIKEEPDFPNTYFQYANLCKKHLADLDVLIENNLVIKYCEQAITNYTLFLNITNEKDLKNYKEYYPDLAKPGTNNKSEINYADATQIVKQYIKSLQEYSSKIKTISLYFNKSVDNYENARRIFEEINNRFLCENDIYLLADELFFKQCNQMISSYDSAVFYISAYSKSIKEFPIGKYKQQFIFKKIETYRLDGFEAESSFLINNIVIWDYGFWAKKTLNIINTEIKDLRTKLEKTEKEISDGIKILKDTTQLFSLPSEYRFNRTTLLKLKKFDFNSLVLDLFLYQKNQLDWLILSRNKQKYDTTSVSPEEKFIFTGKILKSLYACDSFINDLKRNATEKNIQKHATFINNFFGSKSAFINYIETNKKEITAYLNEYQKKSFQLYVSNFIDTTRFLNYKGNNLPLFISKRNKDFSLYTTTSLKEDGAGNTYLSGYFKNNMNDSICLAFFLKSSKNKVLWFKSYETPKSNSYAYSLDYKNKEVVGIISAVSTTDGSISNTLVKLDLNGKEKSNKKISFNNPILCFASDSSASNHLLFSKIYSTGINNESIETLCILYINNEGNTIWQTNYPVKGNDYEVYCLSNTFIVTGTFSYFNFNKQEFYGINSKQNESSVFLLSLDQTGKKIQFLPVKTEESIHLQWVKYYDQDNIHLIAYKTNFAAPLKEDDVIHIIVNKKLQLLFDK